MVSDTRLNKHKENCSNMGYDLLEFQSYKLQNKLKCRTCGDVCYSRLDNIVSGYKPCSCSNSRRIRLEHIVEDTYERESGLVGFEIIGAIQGIRTQLKLSFYCGHTLYREVRQLVGKGCSVCNNNSRLTIEDYVRRVKPGFIMCVEHGNTSHSKSKFLCTKHSVIYEDNVFNHVKTSGCRECIREYQSLVRSKELLSAMSEWTNGNFTPEWGTYRGLSKKMKFMCKNNHMFTSSISSINSGKGCQECAEYGFKQSKPAIFYVIRVYDVYGTFLKFGITNREIQERVKTMMENSSRRYSVLISKRGDGNDCLRIERDVKKNLKTKHVEKWRFPDGYTETIEDNIENINYITKIISLSSENTEDLYYDRTRNINL